LTREAWADDGERAPGGAPRVNGMDERPTGRENGWDRAGRRERGGRGARL